MISLAWLAARQQIRQPLIAPTAGVAQLKDQALMSIEIILGDAKRPRSRRSFVSALKRSFKGQKILGAPADRSRTNLDRSRETPFRLPFVQRRVREFIAAPHHRRRQKACLQQRCWHRVSFRRRHLIRASFSVRNASRRGHSKLPDYRGVRFRPAWQLKIAIAGPGIALRLLHRASRRLSTNFSVDFIEKLGRVF